MKFQSPEHFHDGHRIVKLFTFDFCGFLVFKLSEKLYIHPFLFLLLNHCSTPPSYLSLSFSTLFSPFNLLHPFLSLHSFISLFLSIPFSVLLLFRNQPCWKIYCQTPFSFDCDRRLLFKLSRLDWLVQCGVAWHLCRNCIHITRPSTFTSSTILVTVIRHHSCGCLWVSA